jgi:hypothetical protein
MAGSGTSVSSRPGPAVVLTRARIDRPAVSRRGG